MSEGDMVRGVTVDWWHTLAEPPGGDWEAFAKRRRIEGVHRTLREHGVQCTFARLDLAYDLWTEHLARAWKRREDWSAEHQIMDLLMSAGYDGVADPELVNELREPIGAPLFARLPRLHDGSAETLRALKVQGVRLAIISNTGRTWGHFLRQVQERLGLADVFDHRTFSDEERVRKPAPAIFERTVAAIGLRPEEVVHVGDDAEADVAGARGVGMKAVWYDTGFWRDAAARDADAVIHRWRELPEVLRRW